jgi:superfamily II DNA or RNA helicase
LFSVGALVRRRNAPDQVGVVRSVLWNDQTEEHIYRVQFGGGARTVPETDLELLPDDTDIWADLIGSRTEGAATFQKLLTFERLRRPPSRVAASFGTARAKLLPYQFKPLLKFLDYPGQRILIADDVGLGKTIEAGYILKELKARHGLERVLVVVPARLRPKWKNELERRFDEPFETVSAKEVRQRFIEQVSRGRDLPTFAWVASYESLRARDISDALGSLQPPIDLVIMDEAHKVRNTATQQNALARALAACADAMVLLTATPIQTSREDLFQLLRLMDPVTFERYDVFEEQLQGNKPVVKALAAIRQNPPQIGVARDLLEGYRTLVRNAVTEGEFFRSLMERLSVKEPLDRRAVVDLQRDITELNVTSQVLSRTRKVEVLPNRPVRRATAYKVDLTADERLAYNAVGKIALIMSPSQGWGAVMAAMTAVRYAASCLPAALAHFRSKFGEQLDSIVRDMGEESPEENEVDVPAADVSAFWDGLRRDLNIDITTDTKFERFREALDELWRTDAQQGIAPRKIVVFSWFLGTLAYLSRNLTEIGIEHRVIQGRGMAIAEREVLIDEFLTSPDVRILVSSEVGSEGLDLQQASVVINYDLPWNPMVVEQRIGRIDRLGQESPVLTVLSLVLRNTIEDRILYRLYERIGIFEETIGEIEPILGEQIEKLAIAALRNELSPQEQERQADLAADAFLREQRQGNTLQQQADQLIAGDQAFLDEVESLIGERKVPSPLELFRFLREFVGRRYPGSVFPDATLRGVADVTFQGQVATDLLQHLGNEAEVRRVASRIQQGAFPATFDADAHLRRPRSELLSIHHPLVRLTCTFMEGDLDRLHRAFSLELSESEETPGGDYLLGIIEFTISGARPRVELMPVVWDIDRNTALGESASRTVFVQLLDRAESIEEHLPIASAAIEAGLSGLKRHLNGLRADVKRRENALQSARAARRRATQEATLVAKVKAADQRLNTLKQRRTAEFPIRMAQYKLTQEQSRLDEFLKRVGENATLSIEERDIAVALLRVVPSSRDVDRDRSL